MRVLANGIPIEVEDTGEADRPAVLLVMGLGMQLVAWPAAFVEGLQREGLRVVRFDNRDAGLSQSFGHLGVPNLMMASFRHRMGWPVRAPYTLHHMAADTVGVLDALGIERAHLVGVSLGGMVAQRVALAAPQRVLSLATVMSTSGARDLPGPRPHVLRALMAAPRDRTEEALVDHAMNLLRLIRSPAFPQDEAHLRERVRVSMRRAFHPDGTARQMCAVAADLHRARELARIQVPTLVFHGTDDPLVPFACGHDTARRIPGSQLVAVPGMGHDLPPGVVERLLDAVQAHLRHSATR